MVHAEEEVEDFLEIAQALVINIGTLSPPWVAAMQRAAARATALGTPWVLDPVGCGATPYRTRAAAELIELRPTVIRGNASEILALAGAACGPDQGRRQHARRRGGDRRRAELARRSGAVVAVTGAIDQITDGERWRKVEQRRSAHDQGDRARLRRERGDRRVPGGRAGPAAGRRAAASPSSAWPASAPRPAPPGPAPCAGRSSISWRFWTRRPCCAGVRIA